ncbi:MAG: phosphatase PAP2 family protein [Acidimicrobiia bacterium]
MHRRTLAHPGIVASLAAVALALSWLVARRRPIPGWEIDATRWINDAPAWVAHALWPVMQLGTLWAPIVIAVVVGLVRRDWLLAGCVVGAGVVTWLGAKVVKQVARRGRPDAYIHDLVVRDGSGGLGFVSGHAAMAAAIAVVLMAAVPRRWRPVLVLLAAVVGLARIVHGVHFPADVVGGWAFGVLVGVAALAVYDRCSGRVSR